MSVPTPVPTTEIDRLVEGRHHDPHSLLGAHPGPDGVVVRALRPLARSVHAVLADGTRVELRHEHRGVFSGVLPGTAVPDYRLAVAYDGAGESVGDDGYLELTGRSKELYKSGGELVMPKEIEELVSAHPSVSQVYVVGVPDERWGEIGVAWVVREPGQQVDADELIALCRDKLARFKVPRSVRFLEAAELPVVEVHLSNVHRREAFRHTSYVSLQEDVVIAGAGAFGYEMAVEHLLQADVLDTGGRPTIEEHLDAGLEDEAARFCGGASDHPPSLAGNPPLHVTTRSKEYLT